MSSLEDKRIENAYWAGYVDGEGCISITNHGSCYVNVGQSEITPLRQLERLFGGKISVKRTGGWEWVVFGKKSVDFVRTIFPFLRQKRRQARVLLWAADQKPLPPVTVGKRYPGAGRGSKQVVLMRSREILQRLKKHERRFSYHG